MAMRKKSEEKANVSYFEGFEGIKEMYRKLIKNMENKSEEERSFVAFYAHQKDSQEFLKKYWLELSEEYRKTKVKRKAITTKHPSIKNYLKKETKEKFGMDLRPLSEKDYSSNISIEIYDSFTQIISHRHLQGILIENKDIANVMKQIFNLVWKKTK